MKPLLFLLAALGFLFPIPAVVAEPLNMGAPQLCGVAPINPYLGCSVICICPTVGNAQCIWYYFCPQLQGGR